ncbi:hypothetical protein VTK56DRAFT_6634 [Thermocarpiscus australiensis]
MDRADTTTWNDGTVEENQTPRLFNDVYSSRCAPPAPCNATWAPFPRLPIELRLQIWLFYLQRHRMIEVDICSPADEDDTTYPGDVCQSRYYNDHNHLGKVVSGRGYTLNIRGRGSYAASLSPLLWVNNEARRTALSFYHVHLPFPRLHGERVLYLNSEYDVVYVRPRQPEGVPFVHDRFPRHATILVDFLHDVKAYDNKDQGVAHLALGSEYSRDLFHDDSVPVTPGILHPAAAKSFANILRSNLRSVLCVVGFRHHTRGLGEFPAENWYYHFAQTLPLCRRGHPTGAFHWLRTDPRPGVELDLRQLPLGPFDNPHHLSRGWEELEYAFSITRERRAARENGDNNAELRFYICPTMHWPAQTMMHGITTPEEEGSREELAKHLRFEADDWLRERKLFTDITGGTQLLAKHGHMIDAETFETMEKVPCTAIGMWLFPADAFKEHTIPQRNCFDVSAVRPGLFLFEV